MKIRIYMVILFFILLYSPLRSATLTLKAALAVGLNNNKELRIAMEKVKAAESGVAIARSAYFPNIEAKGNYTYIGIIPEMESASMGYTPLPTPSDPYIHAHTLQTYTVPMARRNNYDASVSLTQPIFMWGRLCNSHKAAQLQLDMERENLKKTRLKIIADIKNYFYGLLLAKEMNRFMETSYSNLKKTVSVSEQNYKAGLITRYDFMAISIQLNLLEPQVLQSRNRLLLSQEMLKNALSLGKTAFDISGEFLYQPSEQDRLKNEEQLLSSNPDLKILSLQKELMDILISLSRAGNKPSLVGILNYKYSYIPAESKTFGGSNPNSLTAILALTIPVSEWFPWSKTMNDIDKSKAALEQVELSLSQLKEMLLLQLEQSTLDLETQYMLIESQKQNLKNAEETYQFREKQYKTGLITHTDLINAENALFQSKNNYLDTVYKTIMARANIDKLLGIENSDGF